MSKFQKITSKSIARHILIHNAKRGQKIPDITVEERIKVGYKRDPDYFEELMIPIGEPIHEEIMWGIMDRHYWDYVMRKKIIMDLNYIPKPALNCCSGEIGRAYYSILAAFSFFQFDNQNI